MDSSIHSITVLNFNSEIGFLIKRPEFTPQITNNYSKQIINFVKRNYLLKNDESNRYTSMEYCLNKYIRSKISFVGKVCVIILFSPLIDIHYVNLFNDSLKRSFFEITNSKKIKMEMFKGPYLTVNGDLTNILDSINPSAEHIFSKSEKLTMSKLDKSQYGYFDIYFQRFAFAEEGLKKSILSFNLRPYSKLKQEKKYREKLEKINDVCKLKCTRKMMNFYWKKKRKKREFFIGGGAKDEGVESKTMSENDSDVSDRNNIGKEGAGKVCGRCEEGKVNDVENIEINSTMDNTNNRNLLSEIHDHNINIVTKKKKMKITVMK